ncbi:uncharacterized protein LOC130688592 [Daphnia carinata]|uniref:uncharacterized protein LOC130688592 n=1 Tax=Daphnia carinata TaxID=120202 RepID=UPI00257D3171|nr:uncharacterized protein LOC130688592 [Daphnia carinata]
MSLLERVERWRLQLIVILFIISSTCAEEYRIVTTWDNRTIDHQDRPVVIRLERHDMSAFKISVDAPFFNDPPNPNGTVGEPFFTLWDYEVVEVFFLNDKNQYVEIELCPWGQHIVLLLNGQRNTIRHSLFIEFTATRNSTHWQGVAFIPVEFLPPNVTEMNAYAIHGSGANRVYESLYPVAFNSTAGADFHNLAAFKPFDVGIIVEDAVVKYSETWVDSFTGMRRLGIKHTWNGTLLNSNDAVELELETKSGRGLIVRIEAPRYGDALPPGPSGWPFDGLSSFEVVHLLLLGEGDATALELQFGPTGHYAVVFWTNRTKLGDLGREMTYVTNDFNSERWKGEAFIPLAYLPPRVYKCNAHSAHGPQGNQRQINSLYPSKSNELRPDFQNYGDYKAIDMTMIYPGNDDVTCSDVWADNVNCRPEPPLPSAAGHAPIGHYVLLLITAFVSTFKTVA